MFKRFIRHTLYGITGAAYSLTYDVLPTFLYNVSRVRFLVEEGDAETYAINSERLFAYFLFAALLSVSQDCLTSPHHPGFFLLRNQAPKGGKAFRDELDEIGFPESQIPESLRDMRINMCVMNDPVILLGDGETYERQDILQWLARTGKSPATGERLWGAELNVVSNLDKRREIEVFVRDKVTQYRAHLASKVNEAKENDPDHEVRIAILR